MNSGAKQDMKGKMKGTRIATKGNDSDYEGEKEWKGEKNEKGRMKNHGNGWRKGSRRAGKRSRRWRKATKNGKEWKRDSISSPSLPFLIFLFLSTLPFHPLIPASSRFTSVPTTRLYVCVCAVWGWYLKGKGRKPHGVTLQRQVFIPWNGSVRAVEEEEKMRLKSNMFSLQEGYKVEEKDGKERKESQVESGSRRRRERKRKNPLRLLSLFLTE